MNKRELPPGYVETAEQMIAAAQRWLAFFPARVTLRLAPSELMYVGNLDERGIALLAGDDVTKQFLRAIDKATNHQATIFLVHCIVDFLPPDRVRREVLTPSQMTEDADQAFPMTTEPVPTRILGPLLLAAQAHGLTARRCACGIEFLARDEDARCPPCRYGWPPDHPGRR